MGDTAPVLLLLASRTFRRLLALVLLAVLAVPLGAAGRVWWVARQDHRPVSDAIVVLGAAQLDGRPGAVLQARLDHAVALHQEGVAPRVVTLGAGAPGDRTTEAAAGAAYLAARDVPAVAVPEGSDTLESLRALDREFARRGWRTAVLVTDPWHSMRAARMASDLGLEVATSPTREGPGAGSVTSQWRYVVRESGAYLYYRAFHRSR